MTEFANIMTYKMNIKINSFHINLKNVRALEYIIREKTFTESNRKDVTNSNKLNMQCSRHI